MEGILTLSKIEHNGFRIDIDYLTKAIQETDQKIKEQERILKDDPIYEQWRRWKGTETKLGSREQLGHVLYNILGFPVAEWCELSRRPKVDETTLGLIDLPFARNYIRLEKLKKIRNTYLGGIQREVVDGYLHPSIHLHTATSFRSSMSNPNLQNVSVRNKEANGIIRRAFIPREGRRLIEIDFSGVEVKGSACVTHDPVLIRYIEDSSTDMHRDMAMECYMVDRGYFNEFPAEAKDVRYVTKNSFVFPQFYGEYYVRCAAAMWKQIQKMNLKLLLMQKVRQNKFQRRFR
jgi:DNA polymerase-1